jgi:adenosine/AMP kinase
VDLSPIGGPRSSFINLSTLPGTMNLISIPIEKPEDMNMILGHAHFIKTVEDLYEAIVQTAPSMKFGLAFCEASGPALARFAGNDQRLVDLARSNAMNLGAGHTFVIFLEGGFPINILNTVKAVPEVCRIYCATANLVEVILAETDLGRSILGVVDGVRTKGIETNEDIVARKAFLRTIGYKM